MSTIDLQSLEVSYEDPPKRTREGSASVLTDELLSFIADAIKKAPDGKLTVVPLDRATPGSAAGMGYQVKKKLAKAPYNLNVRSVVVPANQEAWDDLTDGMTQAQVSDLVSRIKTSGTDEEREAIVFHLGFKQFNPEA